VRVKPGFMAKPDLPPIFPALSDQTRRALLNRLAEGPLPVSDPARPNPHRSLAVVPNRRIA